MTKHTLISAAASTAVALALAPAASAADDHAIAPTELTRIYRGADGSALYTRAVGDKVVGFGEHPGTDLAFVFQATQDGLELEGHWWDVAKGASSRHGTLLLDISQGGSRLARDGGGDIGPESWQAISASGIPWPGKQEAGFQSTSASDLDGAFAGNDNSRAYLRQTNSGVIGVAERGLPGRRPRYATVYIATRSGNAIQGEFYDVPKGRSRKHGTLTGQVSGKPRRFTQDLRSGGVKVPLRAASYEADYAVDLDRFAREIEERLEPHVVGYGYGIAADGDVVRDGAGGARRVPQPSNNLVSPRAFTPTTTNEMASTTKLVTAVAVARALEQRGLSLDDPVDPYLPAQWTRGPGMTTVTFRTLLSHGGLVHPGSICGTDPYACLEQAVALGMTAPPGYNNVHYAIFRVILPFITHKAQLTALFAAQPDEATRNQAFSALFRDEVVDMLATGGVTADFAYPPSRNLAYRYAWGTPPTNEYFPTNDELHYLEAGPGGLKMHAPEFARFLAQLEHGRFLSRAGVAELKADRLGFDDQSKSFNGMGDIGPLYTKNGGSGGGASRLMLFPGDVQVFITRNSTGNPAETPSDGMLRSAWQAALR